MSQAAARQTPPPNRRLAWGGFLLGFALGGFFDGILLHQVLQWHHLLSGVAADEAPADLRFQVLADGLFHVAHYLFAAAGLWLLWGQRRGLASGAADRRVLGFALVGFGVWHMLDAVASHWLLGLHRIRMDVANPLLWDLLWVVPFGLAVAAWGVVLLRRPGSGDGGRGRPAAALGLALAALAAGPVAALPPAGLADGMTLAAFRPGTTFPQVVAAADAVDGRLVWSDAAGGVWLIAVGPGASPARLYRHGALLVSNAGIGAGCLSWARL